jgi:hypothetical protein
MLSSKYYLGDQSIEDENDGGCGMYWEERGSVLWWRNMK